MTFAMKMQDERRIRWEEGYMEGYKEGYEEGYKEGYKERGKEVVQRLLFQGYTSEEISDITGIEVSLVKELDEQ